MRYICIIIAVFSISCKPSVNCEINAKDVASKELFKNISLGYFELNFVGIENFEKSQIGFREDSNGKSLINNKNDSWENHWYVIAIDELGDPIIYNCKDKKFYTSMIGAGSWELKCISNSVSNFKGIIDFLDMISVNRQNPVELENNPISNVELSEFLQILNEGKDICSEYWLLKIDTSNLK